MNLIKTQFNRDYFPELANTKVVISCAVLPKADGSIDSIEVHIIRPNSIMEERKNLYIEHICEILKKAPQWEVLTVRNKIRKTERWAISLSPPKKQTRGISAQ